MKEEVKTLLDAMGLSEFLSGAADIDFNQILELTDVIQDYIIASDDQNNELMALKKKQYIDLYKKIFMSSSQAKQLLAKSSAKERKQYETELVQMAEVTLNLFK